MNRMEVVPIEKRSPLLSLAGNSHIDILDESRNAPLCGGNKMRKLSAILHGEICKGLLTMGSTYSNHCLATACCGALLGLPVRLLIVETVPCKPSRFPNLNLAHRLGAELVFIPPPEARKRIDEERECYKDYFWIPGGGHTRKGLEVYRSWFRRIIDDHPNLKKKDWVVLPFGTGTTALGILQAIVDLNLEIQVIGISVARTKEACEESIKELGVPVEERRLKIVDCFAGQYGKRESHHHSLQCSYFRRSGVFPDPIYNIRVVEFLENESIENGVVINTGGMLNTLLP